MPSTRSQRASPPVPVRAAQYIRMSTDHQEYSPVFQRQAIAAYALAHHIRIVSVYEDAGISGLTLRERPALIQLLLDVDNPKRKFTTVLVYDVSRWGRFQDVDEAAFYEYACRRAGVDVVYVAEPFENDGSPATSVLKALKRAMAAEFSREIPARFSWGTVSMSNAAFIRVGHPATDYAASSSTQTATCGTPSTATNTRVFKPTASSSRRHPVVKQRWFGKCTSGTRRSQSLRPQ
jgi:hypothetical protein